MLGTPPCKIVGRGRGRVSDFRGQIKKATPINIGMALIIEKIILYVIPAKAGLKGSLPQMRDGDDRFI
jgi:hypothetical protein